MTWSSRTLRLDADPRSGPDARRFVTTAVDEWQLEGFSEDAAICAAELTSNAILHSRRPFTIAVRPIPDGIRIDVQDERPDRLPLVVPPSLDPLDTSTTGRGLRLIACLASRWGYFATEVAKTVWVELADGDGPGTTEPLVEVAAARPRAADAPSFKLIDLPVMAALASGMQVDDTVRAVQLHSDELDLTERTVFYEALDQSAGPRLTGRQEAFRAAGAGEDRYSFDLSLTDEELEATEELSRLMAALAPRWSLPQALPPQVLAMRVWLAQEIAAQKRGDPPTPYPA